ncbi:MAG: PAS domain S-box protein [Candidatus Thiodiazotropha sp. L084R]
MTAAATRIAAERRQTPGDLPHLRLSARYRWLLLIVTLPLFIVVVVLAAQQFRDMRAQVLHTLAQNALSHSIAIDGIAKLASDHVLQMKAWSENYLRSPPSYPSDLRAYYQPRYIGESLDGYTLDKVPAADRQYVGQLVWIGDDPRRPEVGEVVLDQALEFFSLARLTHDVTSYFQWSYFFSADNVSASVYPWFSAEEIVQAKNYPSLKAAIKDWFQHEIYLAGTPSQNPQHIPYWTAPYEDAGGTGAMVSHGAPIYVDGKFLGTVGTDLRLVTLEEFLTDLPIDVGRLIIMDDRQMLLADTAGSPLNAMRKVTDVLPQSLDEARLSKVRHNPGQPVQIGSEYLVTIDARHAPWTLIYLVSDHEIQQLTYPRLLPFGVILVALLATVFIALYLLRREFISPALALVDYIQDASREPATEAPNLPSLWQTWVNVVSRAFAETRNAARRVQESEERLQQILNNSSAVVYVRNVEGRFLLVNQPFERLLGISETEVLGKSLNEVFPPHTAKAFSDNDQLVLGQDRVMEFEEEVTLDDGVHTYISNKFPLYDTDGEIYAICGISTDITNRKRSEEVLRQSALGVSAAHGEEIFNSLVMYLSKAIGADYALIGVLENGDEIRTRALCAHGHIEQNITYQLEGSPCQNVVGQQFRFYPEGIQQQFPEDRLLQDIEMESYAAIPLSDTSGEILGLLAVLHGRSLQDEVLIESILQIFAGRAASELERERADLALRASEASYRAIFEASEDAIFVHDLSTGAILDVNRKACEIYGYTYQGLLQLDVGTLSSGVPPYTQEDAMKLMARAVKGEQLRFEWHRKNRDNSLHWDEVFVRRVPIGGIDRILVHTREITARKVAEEKLRASEEQYRSIFNATSDAMVLWNSAGEIVDLNPATWEMGGYTREEFLVKPIEQHIHESSKSEFGQFMHAVTQGRSFVIEAKGYRKDSSIVNLETRTVPMQYQGQPHVLSISRDITEQKRASRELARQREALRQSEKLSAMGELLAGVAHELNNPLAILMGRTALLETKIQDPKTKTEVEKIHTAAKRCGRIVHTFLSMARQRTPERKRGNLNEIVESAIELLGYSLRTSGIDLTTQTVSDLPDQFLDTDQIGQVVINLLVNAQHALVEQPEPRWISVESGVMHETTYLRVTDNGPGVPEDLHQRVFDPFFTTKKGDVGTGIGLSVSRGIVREHGGELKLLEGGAGAAFELILPLSPPSSDSHPSSLVLPEQELHDRHVLIVEDEPEIAEMLAEILQSAGLTTTSTHSGCEAKNWLKTHHCDLILSDIRMPDLDGPGLWRVIKRDHPELVLHTAFISGDTLSAAITPFLKQTGAPLLEKPFTPEQVLALVARLEET